MKDISFLENIAFFIAGLLAGFINTLAGGGSIFTLSLLLFFGIPTNIANGTNRLGIILQNFTGTYSSYKRGIFNVKYSLQYIIPSIIGAILGAIVAVAISPEHLEIVVGVIMVLILLDIFRPKRKKWDGYRKKEIPMLTSYLIFFAIGFYGGFVQAGIGIVIILAFSKVTTITLVRSNAIKMAIIFLYTVPVFAIFVFTDQVNWTLAIVLGIGQIAGGKIARKYAIENSKINIWVKWLIVIMVSISLIKILKIHELALWLIN